MYRQTEETLKYHFRKSCKNLQVYVARDCTILDTMHLDWIHPPRVLYLFNFAKLVGSPYDKTVTPERVIELAYACRDLSVQYNFSYEKSHFRKLFKTQNELKIYELFKVLAFNRNFMSTINLGDPLLKFNFPIVSYWKRNKHFNKKLTIHPGTSRIRFAVWFYLKYNRLINFDLLYFLPHGQHIPEYITENLTMEKIDEDEYVKLHKHNAKNIDINVTEAVEKYTENEIGNIPNLYEKWDKDGYYYILDSIARDLKNQNYHDFILRDPIFFEGNHEKYLKNKQGKNRVVS